MYDDDVQGHAAAAFKTSLKAKHRVRAVSW